MQLVDAGAVQLNAPTSCGSVTRYLDQTSFLLMESPALYRRTQWARTVLRIAGQAGIGMQMT